MDILEIFNRFYTTFSLEVFFQTYPRHIGEYCTREEFWDLVDILFFMSDEDFVEFVVEAVDSKRVIPENELN
jgi:hypothetical protein